MATIAARFIAIGLVYYPLKFTGYGLSWKQYIVMSYGGLRGSHSLLLALAMSHGSLYDSALSSMIITYMGGVVILSLVF